MKSLIMSLVDQGEVVYVVSFKVDRDGSHEFRTGPIQNAMIFDQSDIYMIASITRLALDTDYDAVTVSSSSAA